MNSPGDLRFRDGPFVLIMARPEASQPALNGLWAGC